MKYTNIAIIGANGFIGKHLIEELKKNAELKLNLFGKSTSSEFSNLFPYHQIDLNNTEQLKVSFKEIDLIYYLASESIPSSSWNNPAFEIEKNLLPFVNFLECVCKLKLKKIVFVSSGGTIYGNSNKKLTEESDKKPFSPYGIIKLAMENYLTYFEVKYKLQHDIFRVSNVYGKGQNTSKGLGIVNTFLEKIISEKKINIFGDGSTIRDYVYVEDVAKLLSLSIHSATNKSSIYNLSSNNALSINELVTITKKIIPETFEVVYTETRQSDNPSIMLDNSKILADFPDFNFTEIEDGIYKTYTSLLENKK
ncbi:MAG: NAD-dependent epimerase/dehydratase family protein [Bacteroidota bacterium]